MSYPARAEGLVNMIKIEHRNLEVQVRNFLLPLSLKVFRFKEREAQSFYSGIFISPTPISCDTCPRPQRAGEGQPSRPVSSLNSTYWLFQNLPNSFAGFRCVTSFALCSPVSRLRLLCHLWVTRLLHPRARARTPAIMLRPSNPCTEQKGSQPN